MSRKSLWGIMCVGVLLVACEREEDTQEVYDSEEVLSQIEETFETIESFELETTQTDTYFSGEERIKDAFYYEETLYIEEPFAYWTAFERTGEIDIAYEEAFIENERVGMSEEEMEIDGVEIEEGDPIYVDDYNEPFEGLFLKDAAFLLEEYISEIEITEERDFLVLTFELTENVEEAVVHLASPARFRYSDLNPSENDQPLSYDSEGPGEEWDSVYYQLTVHKESFEPVRKEVLARGSVDFEGQQLDYHMEMTYEMSNLNEIEEVDILDQVE